MGTGTSQASMHQTIHVLELTYSIHTCTVPSGIKSRTLRTTSGIDKGGCIFASFAELFRDGRIIMGTFRNQLEVLQIKSGKCWGFSCSAVPYNWVNHCISKDTLGKGCNNPQGHSYHVVLLAMKLWETL